MINYCLKLAISVKYLPKNNLNCIKVTFEFIIGIRRFYFSNTEIMEQFHYQVKAKVIEKYTVGK